MARIAPARDVSIRAQVVNLLMELQRESGISYLFISHDMAVVERVSCRVAIMYLGQIFEIGPRESVISNPQHPYSQRLPESCTPIRAIAASASSPLTRYRARSSRSATSPKSAL